MNRKSPPPPGNDAPPQQLSLLELTGPLQPAGLREEKEFIAALSALIAEPVQIILTNNRSSVIAVKTGKDGKKAVRLQHVFRAADDQTLQALARLLQKPDWRARRKVDAFLREHQELLENLAHDHPRESRPRTRGQHRDLERILRQVMKEYGFRLPKVRITWSSRARGGGGRSSIKFGSYCFKTATITIHPELDDLEIPDYFVEYIVYHELLHALFPPLPGQEERRQVHGREFKRFEKKFKRYDDARRYEKWYLKTKLS